MRVLILIRCIKAVGVLIGCTFAGIVAGVIGIAVTGIVTQRGDGFVGEGIGYLMITFCTMFVGFSIGMGLANDIVFPPPRKALK